MLLRVTLSLQVWNTLTDDRKLQICNHFNSVVNKLEGHKERIYALIVLKDGRLVSGCDDKKFII